MILEISTAKHLGQGDIHIPIRAFDRCYPMLKINPAGRKLGGVFYF